MAVMVASSAPLDQYIVEHPEYFFERSPEHAQINPDNLEILISHLKCAAFELPIRDSEKFGAHETKDLCVFLSDLKLLHHSGGPSNGAWHWTSDTYPADAVSLRSISSDNFVVVDITGDHRVIAEVAFTAALTTLHEKAIYLHEARQYQVERFDYEGRKAYVRSVDSDYFTDAIDYTQVKELEEFDARAVGSAGAGAKAAHGDVRLNRQIVGFKKIKFLTNENIGDGKLELPENETHTTAFWITLERRLLEELPFALSDRQTGILGLLYALESMASLLLMCDRRDLGTAVGERPASPGIETEWQEFSSAASDPSEMKEFFEPNLYLYDAYPGGIGFSEPLYRVHDLLLRRTRELITGCPCEQGCPSCVGPAGVESERTKEAALAILDRLCV